MSTMQATWRKQKITKHLLICLTSLIVEIETAIPIFQFIMGFLFRRIIFQFKRQKCFYHESTTMISLTRVLLGIFSPISSSSLEEMSLTMVSLIRNSVVWCGGFMTHESWALENNILKRSSSFLFLNEQSDECMKPILSRGFGKT